MYKKVIIQFSFIVFVSLVITSCQSENEKRAITDEEMLEIALYNSLHHFGKEPNTFLKQSIFEDVISLLKKSVKLIKGEK